MLDRCQILSNWHNDGFCVSLLEFLVSLTISSSCRASELTFTKLHDKWCRIRIRSFDSEHLWLRYTRQYSFSIPPRRCLCHFHPVMRVRCLSCSQYPCLYAACLLPTRHCRLCFDLEVILGLSPSCPCRWVFINGVLWACCEPDHHPRSKQRCWCDKENDYGRNCVCCIHGGKYYRSTVDQFKDKEPALSGIVDWVDNLVCQVSFLLGIFS
jgi:hypothetical protein